MILAPLLSFYLPPIVLFFANARGFAKSPFCDAQWLLNRPAIASRIEARRFSPACHNRVPGKKDKKAKNN